MPSARASWRPPPWSPGAEGQLGGLKVPGGLPAWAPGQQQPGKQRLLAVPQASQRGFRWRPWNGGPAAPAPGIRGWGRTPWSDAHRIRVTTRSLGFCRKLRQMARSSGYLVAVPAPTGWAAGPPRPWPQLPQAGDSRET